MEGESNIVVTREGDLSTFTAVGVLDVEEILKAVEEFYAGETTANVLWDISRANFDQLSTADVHRIARLSRKYGELREGGKTAFVFSEDVGFGLGRMFGILQEVKDSPVHYKSFRTHAEAMAWLDEPSAG